MSDDEFREQLHSDAENYYVWCERCQCIHKHYIFTKEDYDRVIADSVQQLADAIDKKLLQYALEQLRKGDV